MKKANKKSKNWDKKVESKIMNIFLIGNFIPFYPYKPQKIVYYY